MRKITPIHWRKLAKVFELDGWQLSRIKGDHLIYTKKGFPRPVVIPKDREVDWESAIYGDRNFIDGI